MRPTARALPRPETRPPGFMAGLLRTAGVLVLLFATCSLGGCLAPKRGSGETQDPFVVSGSPDGTGPPVLTPVSGTGRPPPPPTTSQEPGTTTEAGTTSTVTVTTTSTTTQETTPASTTTTDTTSSTTETSTTSTTTSETTTSSTTTSDTSSTTTTDSSTTSTTTSDSSTTPPPNQPPSASLVAGGQSGPAPYEVSFTIDGADPNGDALTWEFYPEGLGGPVVSGVGSEFPAMLSHTYAAGNYTATLVVSDGSEQATATADIVATEG